MSNIQINSNIDSYDALKMRIEALRLQKNEQEIQLKKSIKAFTKTLSPAHLIKKSLHQLSADEGVKTDLTKVTLNTGVDFLIGKIFGKYSSVKGFLGATIAEKASRLIINEDNSKMFFKIIDVIKQHFAKPKE